VMSLHALRSSLLDAGKRALQLSSRHRTFMCFGFMCVALVGAQKGEGGSFYVGYFQNPNLLVSQTCLPCL